MNSFASGNIAQGIGHLLRNDVVIVLVTFLAIAAMIYFCVTLYLRWRDERRMQEGESSETPRVSEERESSILKKAGPLETYGWESERNGENAGGVTSPVVKHTTHGKTILIADDDPVVVLALSQRLQRMGYNVFRSPDATHALLGVKKVHPDLVILDIRMPSGNGLAVCEMMASDRECAGIPVIIHSVLTDDNIKKRCEQLRTHYVEKSHRSWEEIKKLVESLLGDGTQEAPKEAAEGVVFSDATVERAEPFPQEEKHVVKKPQTRGKGPATPSMDTSENKLVVPLERKPITILCIDDDPVIIRSIALRLQPYGIRVIGVDNGTQGYLQTLAEMPDLILLDIKMPNGAGNYVISKLKDNPRTQNIPVIILTLEATAGVRRHMCSLGAEDFVTKPVHWPTLFAAIGHCIQLPDQLLDDYLLPEQLTVQEV